MKHARITAREHAVVVVEDLDHAAMRAKGGRVKRGINRSLACPYRHNLAARPRYEGSPADAEIRVRAQAGVSEANSP